MASTNSNPPQPPSTPIDDPRRVANRIRDAYTLTEAESILQDYVNSEVIKELERYRTEHAKHHDEEYCLDNFHNFTYIHDRIKELEKGKDNDHNE